MPVLRTCRLGTSPGLDDLSSGDKSVNVGGMRYAVFAMSLLVSGQQGQWTSTVEQVAALVEQEYVDAAAATRIATALRGDLKQGRFDAAKSPAELAQALTRDL